VLDARLPVSRNALAAFLGAADERGDFARQRADCHLAPAAEIDGGADGGRRLAGLANARGRI
jgi:hypothetical protein